MREEAGEGGLLKNTVNLFCPPVDRSCKHEVDPAELPKWKPGVGKIYTCRLCGAKIFKEALYIPPAGEKLHLSKKERRKRRKLNG
jgi:hypothetical protein